VDLIIEGLLRIDPSPEHVSFDTSLELTNGEYHVKGDAGA
jgi:type VI secretion system protein ImpF